MPGFEVIGAEELAEVQDVFKRGGILFRHGFDALRAGCFKVQEFERAFADAMSSKHALAVTSGTAALRVALAALGIGEGDEVIAPSFTFVATIEAIIEARATPVCADIDSTLNLAPSDVERRITPRTKALIAVHMLGTPARLDELTALCKKHGLFLIEDVAWGCGGALHGQPLGTFGDVGTFSFDFAKTMTTGEGGMLIFRNSETYERAAAWHDHGHENNPSVPRWEDTRTSSGFNYRMMELQGAIGLAQLRKLPSVIEAQRTNRDAIWREISDLPGLTARDMPIGSFDTADALVFLVQDASLALRCRAALLQVGISTKILPEAYTWHFAGTWTHMRELVTTHGNLAEAFGRSRSWLSRAVSLPVAVTMGADTPTKIRGALSKVLN